MAFLPALLLHNLRGKRGRVLWSTKTASDEIRKSDPQNKTEHDKGGPFLSSILFIFKGRGTECGREDIIYLFDSIDGCIYNAIPTIP